MENTDFYKNLEFISDFRQLTLGSNYQAIPEDWLVVLTDVINSTNAVNMGKYKDVNALAAAFIAGMLNITKDTDIPFVFGGDGASVLVPPKYLEQSKSVLAGIREIATKGFDLQLRVGIVPVSEVLKEGLNISVTKVKVFDNFFQAAFIGGGLSFAEDMLKGNIDSFGVPIDFPHK